MQFRKQMVVLIVICSAFWLASAEEKTASQIEPVETWSGIHQDSHLMHEGPRMEFVSDDESWKILWKLWTRESDVPDVDFEQQLVIVGAMPGPNRVDLLPLQVVGGDLRFMPMGTLKGGRGFGYTFHVVDRAGIKSVNGVPIQGSGYGNVTLVGVLKSNLIENDGESNLPTITARGIAWELVFKSRFPGRDPMGLPWAEKKINQLDGRTVYLIGSLVPAPNGQAQNGCRILVDLVKEFPQ